MPAAEERLQHEDLTRLGGLHEGLKWRSAPRKAHDLFHDFIGNNRSAGMETETGMRTGSSVCDAFLQPLSLIWLNFFSNPSFSGGRGGGPDSPRRVSDQHQEPVSKETAKDETGMKHTHTHTQMHISK